MNLHCLHLYALVLNVVVCVCTSIVESIAIQPEVETN